MAASDLTRLGKYDVIRVLGRGAMGTVYEGRDPIIDRRVAIKTVSLDRADDPEVAEDLLRFKREAQAAGRLTHPNIVGVYDYGETESVAYIVMEFVEGEPLKALLDRGERFAAADATRMMEALLAGLAYSHDHGVIHRDIKPANVMMTKDGRLKLADFGVARIESSSLTQAGTMIGTPSYMSPEQFMGQTIDARTDLYSAGVLLYQLLTGEKPFEGSVTAIMHKVLNVEPPAPSALSVSATPALDAIVRRAMAKRPEDRFASARDFAAALRVAEAPAETDATMIAPAARPVPAMRPAAFVTPATAETPRRGRGALIAGIAAAVVAIGGGGAFFLLGGKPHHAPTPTTAPATKPTATTTTPAPVPTPAPTSAPTQVPAPTKAEIERKLADAVRGTTCALVTGHDSGGGYTLGGLVSRAARPGLEQAIAAAVPGQTVVPRLTDFTGPYCGLLAAARPAAPVFAPAAARLGIGLVHGATSLVEGQDITLHLRLPGWAKAVEIDYVSSNGQVYRIAPKLADTGGRPAIEADTIGQVGAPYGRDMILAIASDRKLPALAASPLTTTKAFAPTLRAMLAGIAAKGGHAAAAALLLTTTPKP
ncbi:MAG: serine/threonine-protein kinase [Acidiphilium sp.]